MNDEGDLFAILSILGVGVAVLGVAFLGFTEKALIVALLALAVPLSSIAIAAANVLARRRRRPGRHEAPAGDPAGALPVTIRRGVKPGVKSPPPHDAPLMESEEGSPRQRSR